jgi:hypothetical protein
MPYYPDGIKLVTKSILLNSTKLIILVKSKRFWQSDGILNFKDYTSFKVFFMKESGLFYRSNIRLTELCGNKNKLRGNYVLIRRGLNGTLFL